MFPDPPNVNDNAPAQNAPQDDGTAQPDISRKKTVLVMDMSKAFRLALRRDLEKIGYAVIEALGTEDGIQKAAQLKPDLIIFDTDLPNNEGVHCVAKLKTGQETKSIPLVIFTKRAIKEEIILCRKFGATDYLIKTDNCANLMAKVNSILAPTL